MIAKSIQNYEEEDGKTKAEEGRIELSLLILNLGVQCYILSVDDSMSIQHGLSLQFIQMEQSGFNVEQERNDIVSREYNDLQMIFYKLGKYTQQKHKFY